MKSNSTQPIQLKELLTQEQFRKVRSAFARHYGLPLEVTDIDGREMRALSSAGCHPAFCKLVRTRRSGLASSGSIASLNIAIETGQPYTSPVTPAWCWSSAGDGRQFAAEACFCKRIWELVHDPH